jgi:hypothetical protein
VVFIYQEPTSEGGKALFRQYRTGTFIHIPLYLLWGVSALLSFVFHSNSFLLFNLKPMDHGVIMNLTTEMSRRTNVDRPRLGNGARADNRSRGELPPVDVEVNDLVQAESRVEALRSLVMIFLREVESLKKAIGQRQKRKGETIDLDHEMDTFEAALIRDALIKSRGNQRDAAKLLNVKPTTLNAKMKRLRITVETTVTGVD